MLKSPISILQEYVVQQRLPLPSYDVTGDGLSHQPLFTCRAKLGNHNVSATGLTKKEAKHNAAIELLKMFNINIKTDQISNICLLPSAKPKLNSAPLINYVGKLNEFCSARKLPQPIYTDGNVNFTSQFNVVCIFQNFEEKGVGATKKEAKQDAARNMLALLKHQNLDGIDILNTSNQEMMYNEPSNIDEVIEKYSVIMDNLSISQKKESKTHFDANLPATVDAISSWKDLQDLFQKKGWSFKVTDFQQAPLMLKLSINDYMLLKSGDSHEEIQMGFVSDVVRMLKEGIDFGVPLVKR